MPDIPWFVAYDYVVSCFRGFWGEPLLPLVSVILCSALGVCTAELRPQPAGRATAASGSPKALRGSASSEYI